MRGQPISRDLASQNTSNEISSNKNANEAVWRGYHKYIVLCMSFPENIQDRRLGDDMECTNSANIGPNILETHAWNYSWKSQMKKKYIYT